MGRKTKGKIRAAEKRFQQGGFTIPTLEQLAAIRSPTAMQLAEWGEVWPPRAGWRRRLERKWYRSQGLQPPTPTQAPPITDAAKEGPPSEPTPTPRPWRVSDDCAICGRKSRDIVITCGMAPDGTLNVFYFCSDRCKDRWWAEHPVPGDPRSTAAPFD